MVVLKSLSVFVVISCSRPQMEVFLPGSKKPLEHQSPIACLCRHLPAVPEGPSMFQSFLSWLLLPYLCMAGQFFVSHSPFFHGCSLPYGGGCSAELAGGHSVGVGSLQFIATNAFWNVCFPLHSGFASLGHFSIIRMVMENSFCPLLVKLVYLEAAIHVFPSSGFSNKRFKVSYIVLLNKIFCAAFLLFSLDFPWYHLLLCFGNVPPF